MSARAVVVGVPLSNAAPDLPKLAAAPLDAGNMGQLLRGRGFTDVHVRPNGLTVDEFIKELVWLREITAADDLAVVYFSGHGYRLPDSNGDEKGDKRDECLALSDQLLPDDWFRETFWPYTSAGSWWVTCADTCFSGSVMRGWATVTEDDIDDARTGPMKAVETPNGPARIWLEAVGEGEKALQIDDDHRFYSWYSRQMVDLLEEDQTLTYRELWRRLQKRWIVDRANRWITLAEPQMVRTDSAEPLIDFPAFAALQWH